MLLPAKKSKGWIYILAGIFIINMASIYVSRIIIGSAFDSKNMLYFAMISIICSIAGSAGFFGGRRFSYTFIAFNLAGIIYLLYTAISNKSNGWADLTSIAGFMFLSLIGFVIGILMEIIKRKK